MEGTRHFDISALEVINGEKVPVVLYVAASPDGQIALMGSLSGPVRRVPEFAVAEFPQDVWAAFHRVWKWAADKPGYKNTSFFAMEGELLRMHRESR